MPDLSKRPSFATFWKSSTSSPPFPSYKRAEDASPEEHDPGDGPLGDKAQTRRAQVRRAQVLHRQRKANYVKQLELDVDRLRQALTLSQRQVTDLQGENKFLSDRLREHSASTVSINTHDSYSLSPSVEYTLPVRTTGSSPLSASPLSSQPTVAAVLTSVTPPTSPFNFTPTTSAVLPYYSPPSNGVIVTLSMDDFLGTPAFRIDPVSGYEYSSQPEALPLLERLPPLTADQEHTVLNFILSLEHVCWDHFKPDDFARHGSDTHASSCHALMASAFCMASAPPSTYRDRRALKRRRRAFLSRPAAPSVLSWRSSGPTLRALHGLATSVNRLDSELTPVQAWFELATQFPAHIALDARVLDSLRLHFVGLVRCVQFGAVIERAAFATVVRHALETFPVPPAPNGQLQPEN